MDQARVGNHTNVGLHSKVPLLALFGLVHLGVALAILVLRRTRCRDQRSIYHRTGLEQQSLAAHQVVDQREYLLGQRVLLEQMTKSKNSGFVGQLDVPAQTGKLPKQGHIVQGFFHRWVRKGEPLLHEMDAQHCFYRKRRSAFPAFGRIRRYQRNKCSPWHHSFHLRKKFPLARALRC